MSIYGDFYSPEKLLSYGRPWMFTVGSRGIGKSTGWAIYALSRYLEHGEQFLYVRRTDDELQKTCKGYFGNAAALLQDKYPGLAVIYDAGHYYIQREGEEKREECGRALPLSLEHKYKSDNFSKVFLILYDEFMPKTKTGFLGSGTDREREYTAAHSLYVTVDRGIGRAFRNETKMVFIGNNYTYYNPIYISLGIDKYITSEAKYVSPKDALWVVEQTSEVPATAEIKKSYGYGLASDALRAYNYSNGALAEQGETDFVQKITAPGVCVGNYSYMGRGYGVYYIKSLGALYVCSKRDTTKPTLALTTEDHHINYYMALTYRCSAVMQSLFEMFEKGAVRFETRRALVDLLDYFKLT